MNCPQCRTSFRCMRCDRNTVRKNLYMPARECENCKRLPQNLVIHAPVCEKCKISDEKKIHDLESELEEKQKLQHRVCPALAFLKLDNLDRSMEIFKGDVAFAVHGCDKIRAHRLILAGRSPVFRRMFDCAMLENETGLIPIDDASYPVMRAVIDYCYTADINFTDEVPPDEVLKVAHKYDIAYLKDVCEEELCDRICEKTLPEMLRLSKIYEAKTLQEASVKFFKRNFDTVISGVVELGL